MAARKEVRLEVACISKCQESEIATLIMNAVGGQDRSAWVTVMPILPDKDQSKISERDKARFWSMVERTNYCWNWKGGKTQDGYGQISINGKQKYCGSYSTEIEAAKARDRAVVEHKLINPLNFPLHANALAGEAKLKTYDRNNTPYCRPDE